jgi:hypothetical protein
MRRDPLPFALAGLDPAIHETLPATHCRTQGSVDARTKSGQSEFRGSNRGGA